MCRFEADEILAREQIGPILTAINCQIPRRPMAAGVGLIVIWPDYGNNRSSYGTMPGIRV